MTINEVWLPGAPGSPEIFICHHHLRERLLGRLRLARIAADDPLYEAAEHAFENPARWDAFERLAQERRPAIRELTTWLRSQGNRAADQIAAADRSGHVVTDTTAVEQYLAELRGKLALRRATFRNRERLNRLLMLMLLRQRHDARIRVYSHIIREQLLASGGWAGARGQIDDPRGTSSLGRPAHSRRQPPPPVPSPFPGPDDDDIPF